MKGGRHARRAAVALPLVVLALWLTSVTASAHSYLVASDPADGSLLAAPPSHVVLLFSSAVAPDFINIEVVEAGGSIFKPTSVVVDKSLPFVIAVRLPPLPNGSYRLSFTTHDLIDFHQTSGSVVFGIGVAPPSVRSLSAPAMARPEAFLLRWSGLVGLAVVFGGLLLALLIVPQLPATAARRRLQSSLLALSLAGLLLQLVSSTGRIVLEAVAVGGDVGRTLPRLVGATEYGNLWLVGALLILIQVGLVAALWRRARLGDVPGLPTEFRRLGPLAMLTTESRAVLLTFADAAGAGLSGHAAGGSGLSLPETVLRTAHLSAMGIWTGGVVALAFAVMLLRRSGDRSGASAWKLILGFGPYAAVGLAALTVTGLLLSGSQVASLTALFSTPYGLVLSAKVVGAAMVALVGLRHALLTLRGSWSRSVPARVPRFLQLSLTVEGAGAVGLVLLAAALGSSAPARGPQFEPPAAPPTTLTTVQRNTLVASVSVKPNRAGSNLLSVHVIESRRPPPAPIVAVGFIVQKVGAASEPQTLSTTRSGDRFDAGTVAMAAGDLRLTVVVHRDGLADTIIDVPWRVNSPPIRQAPVVISSQPLAPTVNLLALLFTLVTAIAIPLGFLLPRLRARPEVVAVSTDQTQAEIRNGSELPTGATLTATAVSAGVGTVRNA
jgi:copper transport protein